MTKKNGKIKNKRIDFTAKEAKQLLSRVLVYLKPYKIHLIVGFIFMFLGVAANIAGTFFLSVMIDKYIIPLAQGSTEVTLAQFGISVAIMATVYLLGAILSYIFNRLIAYVSAHSLEAIRNEMFMKMQKLPIKYFDTHAHGDIMSTFTNDTDTLREFVDTAIPNILSAGLSLLGTFIMMIVLSPILTLFIVLMLFVMLLVVNKVGQKSGKYFARNQAATGKLNGYIEEHIEGMKVVKVFGHEKQDKEEFDKHNAQLQMAGRKANTYANMLMPIMVNLSYVNYAITAIFGTIMVIYDVLGLTWGKLISFLQYSRQFGNPISQFAQQINSVLLAVAGARRVFALLDTPPEEDKGYVQLVNCKQGTENEIIETDEYTGEWAWKKINAQTNDIEYIPWQGDVDFEHVYFGYDKEKTILKDISLDTTPGQKIALVGSTGAGKTTITNLINRFYDINTGTITYDGIDIKDINKADLRESMALVLQDTHLFTGTVKDNIKFGKLDATDEEIVAASKLANADYFISHLPNGYDTMLTGDGENLSQGQRQLLAIARAAVANPPVLILDEATSSIDTRTEKLIEQGMDKLMEGRTVFVIAHRLSTIRNADMILVLENGEIIERGNHEQLIKQKGKYFSLYTGVFDLD